MIAATGSRQAEELEIEAVWPMAAARRPAREIPSDDSRARGLRRPVTIDNQS